MDTARIPRARSEFGGYVNRSDNFLQADFDPALPPIKNWERLGLTQQAADVWHDKRLYWENTLYPKYMNVNTKTKTVNESVTSFMEEFRAFAQPWLNVIAASPNATQDDANLLNFKLGRKKASHPEAPISLQCVVGLVSLGGAMVKFSCRTNNLNGRPALPDGSNSILIAYRIGDPVPASPNDNTEIIIVSRARDIMSFGIENRGRRLHLFARYYHTRYPRFAGPWSEIASVSL